MPNPIDIKGRRFDRLVALRPITSRPGAKRCWECRCDCGSLTVVPTNSLTAGRTRSCGCLAVDVVRASQTVHGHSSRTTGITPEYQCYKGMIKRCEDRRCREYPNYGGRGISVCDRWKADFRYFLSDMGLRPSADHSIDRIDVNGNYEPGNCRWATATEQQNNRRNNRRVDYRGTSYTLAELSMHSAVAQPTLRKRLDRGWTVEDALSLPADFVSPALAPHVHNGLRTCPGCGADKSVADFNRDKAKSSGLTTYCKSCIRIRNRQSYARIASQRSALTALQSKDETNVESV